MFAEKSVSLVWKLPLYGKFICTMKDFIPKSSLLILIFVFVKKCSLFWNEILNLSGGRAGVRCVRVPCSQIVNPLSFSESSEALEWKRQTSCFSAFVFPRLRNKSDVFGLNGTTTCSFCLKPSFCCWLLLWNVAWELFLFSSFTTEEFHHPFKINYSGRNAGMHQVVYRFSLFFFC